MSLNAFFEMGGYAGYVWPAYGLSVLVVGALIWRSFAALGAARRALADLEGGREEEAP